jgi:putative protease
MLRLAVQKAHEKKVRVYVTLNILLKNKELDQLLDVLSFLEAVKVDGVIIQDWGVFYLARTYFPNLKLHASTQMANHNSVGVNFGYSKGIVRTVLARELTMPELELISQRSEAELEVFVHGALCYSFSGMCLFSSFLGGQGANRGMCKQSCRRVYQAGGGEHAFFSLKDNQQVHNLRKLTELRVRSLKIEGRMKSADYVYQVCKAYRMAIDHPEKMENAVEMLELDMGREKTGYFLGRDVAHGITDDPSTGIRIGRVSDVHKRSVTFHSSTVLEEGYRIRIRNEKDDQQLYLKMEHFTRKGNEYQVNADLSGKAEPGDEVLLVRMKAGSFSSRLGNPESLPPLKIPFVKKQEVRKALEMNNPIEKKSSLFVRISSANWLPKLRAEDYEAVILSYRRSDWKKFDPDLPLVSQFKGKVKIELPKFISEKNLGFYKSLAARLFDAGFQHFFISHLSQKMLLPDGAKITCNENVYVLNDASARMLTEEKINGFCYPLENDLENLLSMSNKQGIVPIYFYPELFYSRMPVKIPSANSLFAGDDHKKYRYAVKDGITLVYPSVPVALFQHRPLLEKHGFNKFLIDYSGEQMTAHVVKRVLKKYMQSEAVQPSSSFNFKLGLK